MTPSPIIKAKEALSSPEPTVFLDVRVGPGAADAFETAHLRGAVRVDVESDLSEVDDPASGGRHPLPSLQRWREQLGAWGVGPASKVVIYDDVGGGMAAARAWWMLRAIGHEPLAVVDGGWQALCKAGAPIETGVAIRDSANSHQSGLDRWPTVDASFVDRIRLDPSWRLVDARAPERYAGITEPLDPVAGHIPGAHNLYWKSQLDDDGRFKSFATIEERYSKLLGDVPPGRVVCYCGSGVTACHLLLAMEACGLWGAQLYVGSWSEWCRQERPCSPA